jgi:ATP-dependent DNA helicase PIF1
MSFSPE